MKNKISLKTLIGFESYILCPFLTTDRFISYCKDRAISTSKKQLEQFEKLGLFFPVARVKFPKIKIKVEYIDRKVNKRKHLGILREDEEWHGDIEEEYAHFVWEKDYIETWTKDGLLWEPSSLEFQDWKNFQDKDGRLQVESYYSMFQCYTLFNLKRATEITVHAENWVNYDAETARKVAERTSSFSNDLIHALQENGIRGGVAPLLCQVLSNRFFPETQTDRRNITLSIPSSLPQWDWDEYCKNWDADSVLKCLNLSIDEIKSLHERLSFAARNIDPLERWYELISFVALDQKKKLKGTALLAQTIYAMEHMIRLFYQELTGEKLFPPNESYNWHPDQYYGEGVTANTLQYLEFLVNQYHLNPRPNLILVVEGNGEEKEFPRLSKKLLGHSFPILGIEVVNIKGIGNATGDKRLDRYAALGKLIDYYHNKQTIVFVVLDDEGETQKMKNRLIKTTSIFHPDRLITKPEYIHLWENKTVEFENFSHNEIAQAMSEISNGRYTFSADEITECENKLQTEASDHLSKFFQEKTGLRSNKPKLLQILFGYIIRNAENEFDHNKEPVRSVVKVLHRVTQLASWNYQPECSDTWGRNQMSGHFGDIKKK